MRKSLYFFLLLFTASFVIPSCKHQKEVASSKGSGSGSADDAQDGSSIASAVVIEEKNETEGVAAEYAWLRKHYPGYSLIKQSLIFDNGKPYDKMDIKTADGSKKTIYFDISKFFGKF